MEAAGMSTTDAAKQAMSGAGASLSSAAANANASLQESAQSVKEGAGNLWERIKTRVSETQETTAREAEEQRIKYAVGRPTTRVILDKQDNVILNVGELITHKAVEDARQAGVLDMLLDSVYDKEPELSQAELRAPEPGEASLEQQRDSQINA
jgi:sRNA-binding protein